MPTQTYIDLFSGCGGFSIGFEENSFENRLKLEVDEWACETLRHNFFGSDIWCRDIRTVGESEISHLKGVDVIIGGPPCQGFSVAGSSQFGIYDDRNELVLWFLEWVRYIQPKYAILENVPTIVSKKDSTGKTFFELIKERMQDVGYEVDLEILCAKDYGAPQGRKRAFFIIRKSELEKLEITPTHGDDEGDLFQKLERVTNVWDAISDLPQINSGEGSEEAQEYTSSPQNEYQKRLRRGSNVVKNHVAMKHTARLIERFRTIGFGQSLKDVAKEHGQKIYRNGEISKKPFKYNNYRLDPKKPSLAIPASFQSLFLHPYLDRNLTAREAARLFGYPDTHIFCGKRTAMSWEHNLSQYNQIGNSVSPLVSAAVARAVGKALTKQAERSIQRIEVPVELGQPIEQLNVNEAFVLSKRSKQVLDELLGSAVEDVEADLDQIRLDANDAGVETEWMAASLYLLSNRKCPICKETSAPNASHEHQMPFLISKEDTFSIIAKNKDHGLDFHLRCLFNTRWEDVEPTIKMLESAGLAKEIVHVNPRTGRRVRGIEKATEFQVPHADTLVLNNDMKKAVEREYR